MSNSHPTPLKSILIKRDTLDRVPSYTTSSSASIQDKLFTPPAAETHQVPSCPGPCTPPKSPPQLGFQPSYEIYSPASICTATAQYFRGETSCPNTLEPDFCPELGDNPWLPPRHMWRQDRVGELAPFPPSPRILDPLPVTQMTISRWLRTPELARSPRQRMRRTGRTGTPAAQHRSAHAEPPLCPMSKSPRPIPKTRLRLWNTLYCKSSTPGSDTC